MIEKAEEEMWTRLKEERAERLALIEQKRSQMKKEMEEEYVASSTLCSQQLSSHIRSKKRKDQKIVDRRDQMTGK